MKIHFCDLCNESVPQSDLDAGRAFLRKGRVICAKCDAIMSGREGGAPAAGPTLGSVAGPFSSPADPPLGAGTSGVGTPPPAPFAAATAPAPPPAPAPVAAAHHHPMRSPRAGGGAAGLAVGLIALLLAVAVAVWAYGEVRGVRSELVAREQSLREDLREARAQVAQTDLLLRQARQEEGSARLELARAVDAQRAALEERLRASAESESRVNRSLEGFGGRLDTLQGALGEVKRHDAELVRLQQRYSALSDELRQASDRLQALALQPGGAPAAAAAPQAAPVAPRPAWTGLVEQLQSPSSGDRWQAVVALGETRDPAVTDHLLPALKDQDIFIRMATARVLGDLGSPRAIPALIEALNDPESAVREAAYIALRTVSGRDLPFDALSEDASERAKRIKAWQDWWKKEKDKLVGS